MIGTIFGIFAFIVGIAIHSALKNGGNSSKFNLKKIAWIPLFVALVVMAGAVASDCVATVPTGHTGVLTTFGKVENRTLDAGLNTKAPWQSVVNMDNRVQKINTDLSCFSSDIQEVSVSYTLNYQIDKANAQEIYKTVGKEYFNTVIVPNIAEAVKLVTARYTAEELISSRAELANSIEEVLTESLERFNIQVVSAAIEDMDFTDAFTNAVEAKQVAAQNKLQAEIEQAQKVMEQEAAAEMAVIKAEAEAKTAKIQAEADLEVAKINADAKLYTAEKEADANKAIAASITDELLNYRYVENWNGILPSTYVGSDDISSVVVP